MRKLWLLLICGALMVPVLFQKRTEVAADAAAEIPETTKYVALTFDDGPKAGTTDVLLDGLRQRGASATFFLVGEQAQYHPDLVLRMQEEGHQVGNHTWSHTRLEGVPPETADAEIGRMESWLHGVLGGSGYWLRPPYGQIDAGVTVEVPMAKWSVDPRDWESRDAEAVVQAVVAATRENSIILLHDIYPTSVKAALRLVDVLQQEGYCFVTVEELLLLNGLKPQNGVLYRTGLG